MNRSRSLILILCFSGLGWSCDQTPPPTGPNYANSPPAANEKSYHFAVHPLHNPAKLTQAYQPLIDYLNGQLGGARFFLEASRDYPNFEEKYRQRQPEFLLPNPWQTIQAMQAGYQVIAMAGEPADFKGIFLVRQDSDIREPSDLKGKAVSYPSPTALAACIMPQYFLHRHGIDVNREIDNRYVGSQESSIMNVWLKKTAAGATWPPPWRAFQKDHPQEAQELRLAWSTEPLLNNAVMARDDISPELQARVREGLLALQGSAAGKAILAGMETARFFPATNQDYEVVRDYVARFEQEVRKVVAP